MRMLGLSSAPPLDGEEDERLEQRATLSAEDVFSPLDVDEFVLPTEMAAPNIAALSTSLPASDGLDFPLDGLFRSVSDGAAPSLGGVTHETYDAMHLSLRSYHNDALFPRTIARDSRRRTDTTVYARQSPRFSRSPQFGTTPPPRGPPPPRKLSEHDRRKDLERAELIEMILESVASVPMALQKINTNQRLRAALEHEIGGQHALLHRYFDSAASRNDGLTFGSGDNDASAVWAETSVAPAPSIARTDESDDDREEEEEEEEENSSEYDSEYENDLAEAVNQLVMSDATLSTTERQISAPIVISKREPTDQTSNSPQSSIFGASPGTYSQDGEPAAALWPRQPHQFAFTQEEEEEEVGARVQDEVYSEMVSLSMCEDESFLEEDEDRHFEGLAKVFELEDSHDEDDAEEEEDDDDGGGKETHCELGYDRAGMMFDSGSPSARQLEHGGESLVEEENDLSLGGGEEDEDDEDEDNEDEDEEREYDVFELRIIREKDRTGFEANEDWRPRIGSLVGARYRVQLEIGEAVFSRTYKCVDIENDEVVCLKVIKNSKEYFDQGVDEIRVLQYISDNCDVDEKHLVRLLDYFYFREHLVIVTELLRDNLYEFSKLLLDRGHLNFFTMPRLKKVAIEVLEALDLLHALGLVHCDLKPENILISNFNECRIKVIDFGSACFVTDELTSYVQSRSYRAPEVILGLGYDQKIDVWSLGCVLAELFTGDVLFKNDSEQSLLERIIGAIGPIPADLLYENSDLVLQFTENPSFAMDATTGDGVLSLLHAPLPSLEELVQTDDVQFLDFLRALLQIHPTQRLSAAEALQHPWLQSGVFSRSRFTGDTGATSRT